MFPTQRKIGLEKDPSAGCLMKIDEYYPEAKCAITAVLFRKRNTMIHDIELEKHFMMELRIG